MADKAQKHRTNQVFKSLHKPLTYLGVERTLFYFVGVGAVGAFNLFNSILAGIAVFIGGLLSGIGSRTAIRRTLTRPLAYFLAEQIRSGKTLLISGGTGTGKTTLLRILADFIPEQERLVVIEDTSELQIQKPNILAVECQTDTFKANITFDDLLKSALRWRPDRIIMGEVRGIEVRTLLDSFNTGHARSLATIHANSAEKALHRFANLVMRNHAQTNFSDTEAEIGEAVDFVVHVERQPGSCIVREVLALRGYDRDAKRFLIEPVFEVKHGVA